MAAKAVRTGRTAARSRSASAARNTRSSEATIHAWRAPPESAVPPSLCRTEYTTERRVEHT
eukprot:5237399-Alexandrium_andersonii.AAC.1